MIITIGRQYGSGGKVIGEKVAKALGYQFYDKEILTMTAEREGYSVPAVRQYDEALTSSLLYGTYLTATTSGADVLPLNQKLAIAQFEVVRKIAQDGNCVIVGRCADYVLRDNPHCMSVFIHADPAFRKERAIQYYGVAQELADKTLRKQDKRRGDYYEFFTQKKWGEAKSYNITIDSSKFGVDGAADAIVQLVRLFQSQK
jgi:cytidylate kinase